MIEPELGLRIIKYGGWALVAIGLLKMTIWSVGEIAPGCYEKIKSAGVKKFMTGQGNRLLFGLGGLLTVLIGGFFILIGIFLTRISHLI